MNFKKVSLAEYCPSVTYQFQVSNLRDTHLVETLIISFHGSYRYGSAGRSDAGLIKGIIKTGITVFDPFAVLIDFSDLEYTWGDNLDLSFEETDSTPTAILVSDKCGRAMSTLEFGLDTPKDIVDNELFFDNYEKALEKLQNRAL